MHEHELDGCRPEPLAHYLKALGVLRLVHRVDPTVRGAWQSDRFVLATTLDRDALLEYFSVDYQPSPILAAWNGGGGLYKRATKDEKTKAVLAYDKPTSMTRATDALLEASAARLAPMSNFIRLAREGADRLGLQKSPNSKTEKPVLLQWLRDHAADEVLPWLDAAFVMEDADTPRYPPLLGTGGNDGNLDFANNYQQHLASLMDFASGQPTAEAARWLRAALFGDAVPGLSGATFGQFDAGQGGGANSGEGFDGRSLTNPWDFVLFMEGALVLAGSASKRLEQHGPGALSFPFTVRTTGAGAGGLALADEASGNTRNEVWLPLWDQLATWPAVERLFGEGRATVGRRPARDGADFARAASSLGVDRGVSSFVRYGFLKRNGLAFVAAPLGRWGTRRVAELDLIHPALDTWLDRFRRVAQDAPASLAMAYRHVAEAVMRLAGSGGHATEVQRLLITLAAADRVVARSPGTRSKLRPVPSLSRNAKRWARAADDDSVEFRLALALAEVGMRRRILPLDERGSGWGAAHDPGAVWGLGSLVDNLTALVRRFEVEGWVLPATSGPTPLARRADVMAFVAGKVDDLKLGQLVAAVADLGGSGYRPRASRQPSGEPVDLVWALAALAWDQRRPVAGVLPGRPTQGLVAAGSRGDTLRASAAAVRRLRISVLRHRVDGATGPPLAGLAIGPKQATPAHTRRCIAALAFPLADATLEDLTRVVFRVDASVDPQPSSLVSQESP